MDIQITPHPLAPEITRVAISGRIDSYTVDRVSEEMQSLIRIGSSRIVCNLASVEFIAGPGLKAFQKLIEQARAQGGGDVKLCLIQPAVAKVIDLAGFAQITDLYDSEEHALQAFGVPGIALSSDATLKPGHPDAFGHTVVLNRKDDPSRFAATQSTCILPSPPVNPQRGEQTEGCGKTQILPRMSVTGAEPPSPPPPPQAPGFEPLRVWIPCEAHFCTYLSQAIDVLNGLMQGDKARADRLGVALAECVRAAVAACPTEAVLGIEISWMGRLLTARVIVPKADFSVYAHLRPASGEILSDATETERWLRDLVGYVDITRGAGEVQITLAPLDSNDIGS